MRGIIVVWMFCTSPAKVNRVWVGIGGRIPKKAANKAMAWEFVKYMTLDRDQQLRAFRALDAFPALVSAQEDAFVDQPIAFLGDQKARQLWKVSAARIPATAVHRQDPVALEIVNAELENVLEKGKDIGQALADAKVQIEKRVRR